MFSFVFVGVNFNFSEERLNEGQPHYEFNTPDIHTLAQRKKGKKGSYIED
jgi:hypothetical protein